MNQLCRLAFALLLAMLLGTAAVRADDEPTYDELAAWIGEAENILSDAAYLAASGAAAYSSPEQYEYAQGIRNLLDGPESGHYNATNPHRLRSHPGILPLLELLVDDSGFVPAIADYLTGADEIAFAYAFDTTLQFARLASSYAQVAQNQAERGEGAEESLRVAYSLLLVARGEISDPLLLDGFSQMADLLPASSIYVYPGESIQAAVDRIPDGGVIKLAPGTYQESLVISKNVTIEEGFDLRFGNPIIGAAVIQGVSWKPTIYVNASDAIVVTLTNIDIRGGLTGLMIGGNATAVCDRVGVTDCATGIEILDSAVLDLQNSHLRENDTAVRCMGSSMCRLSGSHIQECTGSGGAISARESASLEIAECTIVLNRGDGIQVNDSVSLELTNSSISRNFGYGLLAGPDACDETSAHFSSAGPFTGTVTGSGNSIYGSGTTNGNWLGATCPEDVFSFLTAPASSADTSESTEGGDEE